MTIRFAIFVAALAGGAVPAESGRAAEVEIAVDASRAGAAISPYVYGQFIEHLGRCIRDGIWAEKLVDRKFLQEPGKNWQPLKPAGAACDVFLDAAGAYAAPHAMTIWVRDARGGQCGIRQGQIGLIQGQEYVGYALLAQAAEPVAVHVRLEWGNGPDDGQTVTLADVGPRLPEIPVSLPSRSHHRHGQPVADPFRSRLPLGGRIVAHAGR